VVVIDPNSAVCVAPMILVIVDRDPLRHGKHGIHLGLASEDTIPIEGSHCHEDDSHPVLAFEDTILIDHSQHQHQRIDRLCLLLLAARSLSERTRIFFDDEEICKQSDYAD